MSLRVDQLTNGLLRVYAAAFPAKERLRVAEARALDSDGWESDLYACDLEYEAASGGAHDAAVLKLYHGEQASEKAEREFGALRSLTEAGFPVPRPLAHSTDDAAFGHPYVLMERVAGREMRDVLVESDEAGRGQLWTLFCRLFADLHALDWRPFASNADEHGAQEHIHAWLGVAERYVAALPLPAGTFTPAFAWLREREPAITCDRLSVLHWDYHLGNVLLHADGTPVVIDWTGTTIADYRLDLAWTLLLSSTYGLPEWRELILTEYERIASRPVEQIEFFDVIACTRRMVDIATTLCAGTATAGMRPEAAAAVHRQADHVRRVYALLRERIGLPLPELERMLAAL